MRIHNSIPKAVLWPTEENYSKFREACDDILPRTFDEFMQATTRHRRRPAPSLDPDAVRLDFDPDAMADWCRLYFSKVDSTARRYYASFLLRSGCADDKTN